MHPEYVDPSQDGAERYYRRLKRRERWSTCQMGGLLAGAVVLYFGPATVDTMSEGLRIDLGVASAVCLVAAAYNLDRVDKRAADTKAYVAAGLEHYRFAQAPMPEWLQTCNAQQAPISLRHPAN